jgi:RNA 3'-terminal phosphate cyclase (ATP)
MIHLDGSRGEGGGQILRTSLALAMITGKSFQIRQIRAGRAKPGLMRQHLTAVKAAANVCDAEMEGAELKSQQLTFKPGTVRAGDYRFDIGTAGSATLVLQTVLPALMTAEGPSQLTLCGGTHNIHAPPYDFLAKAFLPLLKRMGPQVTATLVRHGFFPAGGGEVVIDIQPVQSLKPLELIDGGPLVRRHATALVSRLPRHIAERELATIRRKLELSEGETTVEEVESVGPGNVVVIEIQHQHVTEVVTGFGQRGVKAEKVAADAVREAKDYLAANVPVGEHLADQLLLPLALAGGGRYRTTQPTPHTTTNVETIGKFLDVAIEIDEIEDDVFDVHVGGRNGSKGVTHQ